MYEPNGNGKAPDYLLNFSSYSVLGEVQNLGDGFIKPSELEEPQSRINLESSSKKMEDKIKNSLKDLVSSSETVLLTIMGPIPYKNRGKLATKIANLIKISYGNKTLTLDKQLDLKIDTRDKEIPSLPLKIILMDFYKGSKEYSSIKIVLACSQTQHSSVSCSLYAQTRYMLLEALSKKEKKLKDCDGNKWLLLINNHPLLSYQDYLTIYKEISKELEDFNFSKVFLVMEEAAMELKK